MKVNHTQKKKDLKKILNCPIFTSDSNSTENDITINTHKKKKQEYRYFSSYHRWAVVQTIRYTVLLDSSFHILISHFPQPVQTPDTEYFWTQLSFYY